uniref:hypothetical protein n=1 Tax=Stappia sp. TaxID=1870903 RepID=UPI003BAD162C
MEPTTLTSLSGSLMSLFGLLVSLFSVHLGNWLSKLQGLRTRWDINSGSDDREVATRRECRYIMAEIYTWQPFVMTLILMIFGGSVLYFFNDVRNTSRVTFPSIFVCLYNSFFAIMFALQIFLLFSGWRVGERLKKDIEAQFPKPKA